MAVSSTYQRKLLIGVCATWPGTVEAEPAEARCIGLPRYGCGCGAQTVSDNRGQLPSQDCSANSHTVVFASRAAGITYAAALAARTQGGGSWRADRDQHTSWSHSSSPVAAPALRKIWKFTERPALSVGTGDRFDAPKTTPDKSAPAPTVRTQRRRSD